MRYVTLEVKYSRNAQVRGGGGKVSVTGSYNDTLRYLAGPTDIHFLVYFLNVDFNSVDPGELKRVPLYGGIFVPSYRSMPKSEKGRFPLCKVRSCSLKEIPVPHTQHPALPEKQVQTFNRFGPLMWLFQEHERADLVNKAKDLQEELVTDIRPFVSEPKDFTVVCNRLAEILRKANWLKITSRWALECDWKAYSPAPREGKLAEGEQWVVFYDPSDPNTVNPVINPRNRAFGSGERMLEMAGGKFVIRRSISKGDTPQKKLYALLISTLESGDFKRLKKCSECQTFFVTKNRRHMKFCSSRCYERNDYRNATERMRVSREKQQAAINANGLPKLDELLGLIRKSGAKSWEDVLTKVQPLSSTRGHLKENFDAFEKAICESSIKEKPEKIWERLPLKIKRIFAEIKL